MNHHGTKPRPVAPPSGGPVVFVYMDSFGRPRHLRSRGCPDVQVARMMIAQVLGDEVENVQVV